MACRKLTGKLAALAGALALGALGACDDGFNGVGGGDAVALAAGAPARDVAQYTIADLMGSVTYRGLSFSPDGSKVLTSSNASGIYNVVAIPSAGGEPAAITESDDSTYAIGYFPNDERILYRADKGGNEMQHIYARETDGTVTDLTPGEGRFMARFHGWATDGQSFYVETNERNIRHFDLYEYAADGYAREMIYRNDDLYYLGPVSPDRRKLVLEKGTDNRSRYIAILDFESGGIEKITLADMHIMNIARAFSPDGKYLYYTTDKWREFQYLVRYDMESKSHEEVVSYDWDVAGPFGARALKFSRDGARLLVATNQDARTVIDVFDTATMERLGGSAMPEASANSFDLSADGAKLAMIVTNGQIPGDIYVQDVGQGEPRRVMSSLGANVEAGDLVPGEVTRYHSFDGVIVPGTLYKPWRASAENKVPALVMVHGGPGGQTRIGYRALVQYLVNHGYAIFGINNRGSSGDGKTFYHLDDQDHGGGDLQDVVASKQMLIDTGWVDPDRIGIMGGSYGGYMVLAALAFEPEVFDLGVNLYGVANWVATLKDPPPWWAARWIAMQTEMGDFYDEPYWTSRSPYFHADKITKPMIVLQGANDPRVTKVETDEMVATARANGVPVEYVVFDDEGHGFRKKKNQATANEAILKFLDARFKGAEPAT